MAEPLFLGDDSERWRDFDARTATREEVDEFLAEMIFGPKKTQQEFVDEIVSNTEAYVDAYRPWNRRQED